MKNKKLWKILLPIIIAAKIAVIILILGSAKSDNSESEIFFSAASIPNKVLFAGEQMPINQFYVRESLDRELLSNVYFHSQTIRYIKLAPRYFAVIEPILKEKGIPDDFKYLAVAESGFNPRAISPAHAVGFWQFMKGTAKDFGLEVNGLVDERYHIEKATYAACNYLLESYKSFGNWTLVAASYNRGMAGISKQMARQKTDNYYDLLLTTETARYLYRITALKLILENPEQYNFKVSDDEKYPIIKTKDIEISGKIENFADFAHTHEISYKLLKDFNPWLRDNYLTNSTGKKYIVKIPILK